MVLHRPVELAGVTGKWRDHAHQASEESRIRLCWYQQRTRSMKKNKSISPARHAQNCTICRHRDRVQIEQDFIAWHSQAVIAREYKLGSRLVVYRHARALGLVKKRNASVRGALCDFIERSSKVRPTAAAFVAACSVLSRLDREGRDVARVETVGGNDDLFHRMTRKEMLEYAEHGTLPEWFTGDTPQRTREVPNA
jgi:hypothetical protein